MTVRRWWGLPLVPLYWVGLRLKDGLRALGILRTRRLRWPVVSVGSLSAGGAGKTPVVIALAELLQASGWNVDVLSRGYGRQGRGVERVNVAADAAASRFGDEPVLIAQRAGASVWVGADRYVAGTAAEHWVARERTAGPSTSLRFAQDENQKYLHLLDDGLQHRQLARTMDVVVVTTEDLNDALLPAGNRRESLSALRRADAVVVRDEERDQIVPRLQGRIRADACVWEIRRQISFSEVAPVLFSDVPTYGHIAFSAIAKPENFLKMLQEVGVGVIDSINFPDHHAYTLEDMSKLVKQYDIAVGHAFVTTEKDAVKLSPQMRAKLEAAGPLIVARLESLFASPEAIVRAVEAKIS